jgi:tetratricopeptide (TPR) repeat protein
MAAAVAALALPYLSIRYLERGSRTWRSAPGAAFEDFDRARRLNPLSPAADLRAGTIAVSLGRLGRARSEFRDSIRIEDTGYARLELALIAAHGRRWGEARSEIARAARLNARDFFVAEARSRILRRQRVDPGAFNRRALALTRSRFTTPTR